MLSLFADWQDRPALWPAAALERQALEAGDIPTFWARAESTALRTRSGVELPDVFAASGLSAVGRELGRLSEEDLAVERDLLEAALGPETPAGPMAAALAATTTGSADEPGALAVAAGGEIVAALEAGAFEGAGWTLAEGRPGAALLLAGLSDFEGGRVWRAALDRLLAGAGRADDPEWSSLGELPIGGLMSVSFRVSKGYAAGGGLDHLVRGPILAVIGY